MHNYVLCKYVLCKTVHNLRMFHLTDFFFLFLISGPCFFMYLDREDCYFWDWIRFSLVIRDLHNFQGLIFAFLDTRYIIKIFIHVLLVKFHALLVKFQGLTSVVSLVCFPVTAVAFTHQVLSRLLYGALAPELFPMICS